MNLKVLLLTNLLVATGAQAGPPSLWTQSQWVTPCELAQNGDATKAFNSAQDGRDATEAFKAAREGREIAARPHVDRVWYDCDTQLFHWKGPVTGKEMSMSRKQFMREIWFPYFKWIDLHTSF